MQWSQVKAQLDSRLAASLKNRVRVEVTRYRRAHDAEGRWAIVVDDVQIAGIGCIPADQLEASAIEAVRMERGEYSPEVDSEAQARVAADASHTVPMFYGAVGQFLQMPIDDALVSADGLIRCLALMDRRVGKRRLRDYTGLGKLIAPEAAVLRLRREAEGV